MSFKILSVSTLKNNQPRYGNFSGDSFRPVDAIGGTITQITVDGRRYRVHSFTSTGTSSFEIFSSGNIGSEVEYLVVGGGGGASAGRDNVFGSGGSGGNVIEGSFVATVGSRSITVGGGGGAGGYGSSGGTGGTSSILNVASATGGAGGSVNCSNCSGVGASGNGRTGIDSSLRTGSTICYGGGGVGGYTTAGTVCQAPGGNAASTGGISAPANGGGGGTGSYNRSGAGNGGSGLVVLRYPLDPS